MSEWQPVETMPLEVTVLAYTLQGAMGLATREEHGIAKHGITLYMGRDNSVTHWMPLPAPPKVTR